MTRDLLVGLKPAMLLLADRNFLGWRLWREAAATGAELLWRARASFHLPVRRVLADGTYLCELRPARRRDGQPIPVRVIEYSIVTDDGTSELFCLLTTLLDPATAPAAELAGLYAQRWGLETALKEIKVSQRGSGPSCCAPTTPTASDKKSRRCSASTRPCETSSPKPPTRPGSTPTGPASKAPSTPPAAPPGRRFPPRRIKRACEHLFAYLTTRLIRRREGKTSPRAVKRRSAGPLPRRTGEPIVCTLRRRIILHPLTAKIGKTGG